MERILRISEVRKVTGLARTTIWRLERERLFPARCKLGARSIGWLASEVSNWLRTRARAVPAIDGRRPPAPHSGRITSGARRTKTGGADGRKGLDLGT